MRELMFEGRRTFREFATSGEGITMGALAAQLSHTEDVSISSRNADPDDGRYRTRCTAGDSALDPPGSFTPLAPVKPSLVQINMTATESRFALADAPIVKVLDVGRPAGPPIRLMGASVEMTAWTPGVAESSATAVASTPSSAMRRIPSDACAPGSQILACFVCVAITPGEST